MNEAVTSLFESLEKNGIRLEARSSNIPNSYELDSEGDLIALNISEIKSRSILYRLSFPFSGFEKLQKLDLSRSNLYSLTFEKGLPALTYLDISYNEGRISSLIFPQGFDSLQFLYLFQSNLESVRFEGSMPYLEVLHLAENALKAIVLPTGLERLETLYLKENQLEAFRLNLKEVPNLAFLSLEGNPIKNIDKSFFEGKRNCWGSIYSYLLAEAESGVVINTEAKCIFFGNGRVGKTTLFTYLDKKVFDTTIESTHGILISEWKIEKEAFPATLKQKIEKAIADNPGKGLVMPEEIVLNVWDFGGQEYYHATHRLFLNTNVLFVLMWDTETNRHYEDTAHEIEDFPLTHWRENIQYYALQNLSVEVQNKVRGGCAFNPELLQFKVCYKDENQQNNQILFDTDIDALKEGIFSQLYNLTYLGNTIPVLYDAIRTAVKESNTPFLDFETYKRDFCIKNDNTKDNIMQNETEIKTVTHFLHETGRIICYRYDEKNKSEKIKDYVFTKPQWVTDTIYEILDGKTLKECGEFDEAHVAEAIQRPLKAFPDFPQPLSAAAWIELMIHFKLIFEIERDGQKKYVAPQYLPKNCTNAEALRVYSTQKTEFCFCLRFPTFLPKSVIVNFISDYGAKHELNMYWKNALVFKEDTRNEEEVTAFVQSDSEQRTITVSVRNKAKNMDLAVKIFRNLIGLEAEREHRDKPDNPEIQIKVAENGEWVQIGNLFECPDGNTQVKTFSGQWISMDEFKPYCTMHSPEEYKRAERQPEIENIPPLNIPLPSDGIYKILMLTANPSGTVKLNLDKEHSKIALKLQRKQNTFPLITERAVDKTRFREKVYKEKPAFLHFSGHGEALDEKLKALELDNGGLMLQNDDHNAYETLSSKALDALFEYFIKEEGIAIQAVILNACWSENQASVISKYVPFVIGTTQKIKDTHAIEFSVGFYFRLAESYPTIDIPAAFMAGRVSAVTADASKSDFVIYQNGGKIDI